VLYEYTPGTPWNFTQDRVYSYNAILTNSNTLVDLIKRGTTSLNSNNYYLKGVL
jgi:hypothetical protein